MPEGRVAGAFSLASQARWAGWLMWHQADKMASFQRGGGWAAGSWPPPQPALRKSHSPEMSSRLTSPLELCQGTSEESRSPPFLSQCFRLAIAGGLVGTDPSGWRLFPSTPTHLLFPTWGPELVSLDHTVLSELWFPAGPLYGLGLFLPTQHIGCE